MKYDLTRTRKGGDLKCDVHRNDESFHTDHQVSLVFSDLTRGESEFYMEALFDFLNNSEELKKEYFRNKDHDTIHCQSIVARDQTLQEMSLLIDSSKRLSSKQKTELQSKLERLSKIIEVFY